MKNNWSIYLATLIPLILIKGGRLIDFDLGKLSISLLRHTEGKLDKLRFVYYFLMVFRQNKLNGFLTLQFTFLSISPHHSPFPRCSTTI
ncbi:MAG: hypothetical protein JO011_06060 [Ktedonobacteraceae bacterium]|nr:hypothetical protein [Ktedonobacteraceae bacterium]MBV9710461.1 hypothetical protein [Ktedonobacteraceae bacterium]